MFNNHDKCTCHEDDRLENKNYNKKVNQLKKKSLKDSDFLIIPKKKQKKKLITKKTKKKSNKKILNTTTKIKMTY